MNTAFSVSPSTDLRFPCSCLPESSLSGPFCESAAFGHKTLAQNLLKEARPSKTFSSPKPGGKTFLARPPRADPCILQNLHRYMPVKSEHRSQKLSTLTIEYLPASQKPENLRTAEDRNRFRLKSQSLRLRKEQR